MATWENTIFHCIQIQFLIHHCGTKFLGNKFKANCEFKLKTSDFYKRYKDVIFEVKKKE